MNESTNTDINTYSTPLSQNLRDKLTSTLKIAVKEQHYELATLILRANADPNKQGTFGESSLKTAVENDDQVMVELLLSYKADPNQADHRSSLLMKAVEESKYKLAKILLSNKADPNKQGSFGESSLKTAVEKSDQQMVKTLLLHKADPNIQSRFGDSVLKTAIKKGYASIEGLLIEYGAKEVKVANMIQPVFPLEMQSFLGQGGIIAGGKVTLNCGGKLSNSSIISGGQVEIRASEIDDTGVMYGEEIIRHLTLNDADSNTEILGQTTNLNGEDITNTDESPL